MKHRKLSFHRQASSPLCALLAAVAVVALADSPESFVQVSPRDPRYLELSGGQPYIPIGLNLIAPDGARGADETNGLARMEAWMDQLAAHGGNYLRIWLSSPFWDVEHERAGRYDAVRAQRTDRLLAAARQRGLRVKLTLEHFREMSDAPRQRWANKPLLRMDRGGTATNVADFFRGDLSRTQFRGKLNWYASRYANRPEVYGWELWNEVNATEAQPADYLPWTETMLGTLHALFPRNLALQSLGSFDSDGVRDLYRRHSRMPGNDVAQVHRYLDLGAPLAVCRGPMDVLVADAIGEIRACSPGRPVVLAEGGAVEPGHSGPFKLYAADPAGTLLHDVLFAAFFAGAAGPGQIWHWDAYVDRNGLWYHFGRFSRAVADLDPPAEQFTPVRLDHPRLRVYVLRGRKTVLAWCRDSRNSWQEELRDHQPPDTLRGLELDCPALTGVASSARGWTYDPWKDRREAMEVQGGRVRLPPFSRSIVLRLTR